MRSCTSSQAWGTKLDRLAPARPLFFYLLGGLVAQVLSSATVNARVINFDNLSTGDQPGNVLSTEGVTFTTCDIPDDIQSGDMITVSDPRDGFEVLDDPNYAVSPPAYALPLGRATADLLITFAAPVAFVSVRSDHFPSDATDLIRLVALAATDVPGQFEVLTFVNAYDDAVGSPQDLLALDLSATPTSFVVFQSTTELEGFDNLAYTLETAPPAGDGSSPSGGSGDSGDSGGTSNPDEHGSSSGPDAVGGPNPPGDGAVTTTANNGAGVDSTTTDETPSDVGPNAPDTGSGAQNSTPSVRGSPPGLLACPGTSATILCFLLYGFWLTRRR
jgi:hypothetical protein